MGKTLVTHRVNSHMGLQGNQAALVPAGLTFGLFPEDVLKKLHQGLAVLLVLNPRQLDSNIKGGTELGGRAGRTQEMSEVMPIPIPKGVLGSLLSPQEWRGRMAFGPQQGLLSDTSARFLFLSQGHSSPSHSQSVRHLPCGLMPPSLSLWGDC